MTFTTSSGWSDKLSTVERMFQKKTSNVFNTKDVHKKKRPSPIWDVYMTHMPFDKHVSTTHLSIDLDVQWLTWTTADLCMWIVGSSKNLFF